MVYSDEYLPFASDKYNFFFTAAVDNTEQARIRAEGGDLDKRRYQFLATNKTLIEQEFNQLFATLKKKGLNSDGAGKKLWLYCYYCSIMLKNYYEIHGEKGKANDFTELAEAIKGRCDGNEAPMGGADDERFLKKFGIKVAATLKEIKDTPFSISKIIDNVGFANVSRIYWYFCRTSMKHSLFLARELQWIEKLGNMLGKEIDVDAIVHTWEKPNHIFRALSVGFFAIRFILNAGIVLKHTIAPTDNEDALTAWQRFSSEIYQRHAVFINDLVWGTVNGLTNYNEVFGISNPVAAWATAGFLIFDICLILYRREVAKEAYLIKSAEYRKECAYLRARPEQPDNATILDVLEEQIKQLNNSWETESSTYLFNATGALLLMMGFSASMLLTPAALVLGSYMVCTLGVSIYLSDGAYNNYNAKGVALRDAQLEERSPNAIRKAQWEYDAASDNFYFTLGKNAVMPALFMTTMAISWPAALVMTAAYSVYSLGSSYRKHNQEQAMQLSLNMEAVPPEEFRFAM